MRISLKWLNELVEHDTPTAELAKRLNGAGLEVARIDVYGKPKWADGLPLPDDHLDWDGIHVGRILEVRAHPDADRLRIAIVDCGDGPQQSVTGAPNIDIGSSGQKVAVAGKGARIINAYAEVPAPVKVRPAKLRGERSDIVLCSERELSISGEHGGILLLDDAAPVGTPLSDVLGDVVIEVELTPNLARCLNMVGVAREVAALMGGTLKFEEPTWLDGGPPIEGAVKIAIAQPQQCARFTAALIRGVHIGPSPFWLRQRLTLAGMRPINNIVDITNLVMLEWGQPLHAYDYATIQTKDGVPFLEARLARAGEALTTLDGAQRAMDPEMLVIADGAGPVGLAGVMGGLDTEIGQNTTDILLEAANFNAIGNRRTAQRLKLFSEASTRFSKGLPPELPALGLKRAAEWMRTLCGGTIAKGFIDVFPTKRTPTTILLPVAEPTRLLGVELDAQRIVDLLSPQGFACEIERRSIRVQVPYHRLDVNLPADLVEEVARMLDYDKLPVRMLEDVLPEPRENQALQGKVRAKGLLTQLGLQEVINYTLTDLEAVAHLNPDGGELKASDFVQLENTLSSERALMRQTMLPGLLETARRNWRFQERVAIFEVGRVYLPRAGEALPEERTYLALLLVGRREAASWVQPESGELDFFDLKGLLEVWLKGIHLPPHTFRCAGHPSFHPGRCAEVVLGQHSLGVMGELHPHVAEGFGFEGRVCAAELNLDAVLAHLANTPDYDAPPRFPAVEQDIAVVVAGGVLHSQLQAHIHELGGKLLCRVELFDVYVGEGVPEGKRSLAYALTYQAPDRTLTDDEVNEVHQRIQRGLRERLGAEIRGVE